MLLRRFKTLFFTDKNAFSIAEAMMTLLIVSVALAAAAPLISRQVKNSTVANIGAVAGVPYGAVMYFDPDLVNACPDGWEKMPAKYEGRYFRAAGTYDICDKSGENTTDGECSGSKDRTVTLAPGTFSGDNMRRIRGTFPGNDADVKIFSDMLNNASIGVPNSYVKALKDLRILTGAFDYVKPADAGDAWDVSNYANIQYNSSWKEFSAHGDYIKYIDPSILSSTYGDSGAWSFFLTKFDSQAIVPTDAETTPKSVSMLVCRKVSH